MFPQTVPIHALNRLDGANAMKAGCKGASVARAATVADKSDGDIVIIKSLFST